MMVGCTHPTGDTETRVSKEDRRQRPCGLLRAHGDDAQAVAVGEGENFRLVEKDGPASLDREHSGAGLAQVFDGGDADGRYVESHVLLRLGDLDERPAARPAELAG